MKLYPTNMRHWHCAFSLALTAHLCAAPMRLTYQEATEIGPALDFLVVQGEAWRDNLPTMLRWEEWYESKTERIQWSGVASAGRLHAQFRIYHGNSTSSDMLAGPAPHCGELPSMARVGW
jgi:hypothetical protein